MGEELDRHGNNVELTKVALRYLVNAFKIMGDMWSRTLGADLPLEKSTKVNKSGDTALLNVIFDPWHENVPRRGAKLALASRKVCQ